MIRNRVEATLPEPGLYELVAIVGIGGEVARWTLEAARATVGH